MDSTTGRVVGVGVVAGMVAGAVMAMYAMMASATFLGQGFFTPLYGIAAPIVGSQAMTTSMQQGLYFSLGPAMVGLVIHMMSSAMFGVIFALMARAAHLASLSAIAVGVAYGVVVMLVMGFVVLPIVGAGAMPSTVGWPSFAIQHMMYGLVLGLWASWQLQDVARGQSLGHAS